MVKILFFERPISHWLRLLGQFSIWPRFGDTCWYSHEDNEVQNVSSNQGFQDGQVTLPPEIHLMVTTMMEKVIEIWQQKGSKGSINRSQGH